jgi:hypothetical protein
VELSNGHLTNGGEIEKRKAFPLYANVAITETGAELTAGVRTFGMQATAVGLTVFGSALAFGTSPTLSQPVLASAMPSGVTYQQLQHPAVIDGVTYDKTKHAMTDVRASWTYAGNIFALATFADGDRFGYYNGTLDRDFTDGLRLAHLSTNALLAADFARMVNDRSDNFTAAYTATNVYADVSGPVATDFEAVITKTLQGGSSGTLVSSIQTEASPGSAGSGAKAKFRIIAGKTNASATCTLTNDGTAPANGSSITINGRTYTWKTAISLADDVLIGNTVNGDAAMQNLADAINYTGIPGVAYIATGPHATVKAGAYDTGANTLVLTARTTGTVGNAYAITASGTHHLTIGSNPMAGGLDTNKITSILAGTFELLSASVNWEKDSETTAENVVSNINAGSHGFTAESIGEDVFITAPVANTGINGSDISVTVAGQMCIGSLFAAFVVAGTGFTLVQFNIDGVDVKGAMAGGLASASYATLELFCSALADSISAYSGGNDYSAVAVGAVVYVSKYVTSSADAPLNAFVTITVGAGGTGSGVTINNVPQTGTAQVILSAYTASGAGFQGNNVYTELVTSALYFGSAPYGYSWVKIDGHPNIYSANLNQDYTKFHWNNTYAYPPGTYSARFKLVVTDNLGTVSESDPITAFFTITFN